MTVHVVPLSSPDVAVVGDWTRLSWSGDLDIASSPVFQAALTVLCDREVPLLELDLEAVTFMDCAGVLPLLQTHARLGDRMRLYAPSRPVTWLLSLIDLTGLFVVVGPDVPSPTVPVDLTESPRTTRAELVSQVAGLQIAISNRAGIEQAKGMIMGCYGCTSMQAWELLRRTSKEHHVRIRVLAEMVVASVSADAGRAVDDPSEAIRLVMGTTGWPVGPRTNGSLAGYSGPP